MKRLTAIALALMLAAVACGGGNADDPGNGSEDGGNATAGGGSPSGNVVDAPPPGQGYASVDGLEYTLDLPGGLPCEISDEEFTFSYRIGDNEVVLGGGASISGGQWFGSLSLSIFANNQVTEYVAKLVDNPNAIAVDGDSVSYSGPMEKHPPSEDGTIPEPVDVGEGTFSATCG